MRGSRTVRSFELIGKTCGPANSTADRWAAVTPATVSSTIASLPSACTPAYGQRLLVLDLSGSNTHLSSLFYLFTNDSVFSWNALPAVTCFDEASSLQNGDIIPIVRPAAAETRKRKARINPDTSDMCFSFPPILPTPVFFLLTYFSVGGGEDYRQNPVESHQSTEGELQFCAHVAATAPWLPCTCISHYFVSGS